MNINGNAKAVMAELDKRMKAACEVVGGIVESAAKGLAPADTGLLRNSITHGTAGGRLSVTEYTDDAGEQHGYYSDAEVPADASGSKYVVVIGSNVHYAPYQELGTHKMPAQPFLRPAVEGNADAIKAAIEKVLKD